MEPNPAEEIAKELQALQQPGEAIRKGPGGALYLGDRRFFVAWFNPSERRAIATAFPFAEIGEVRVEQGAPKPEAGKEASWFVEIGHVERPPLGIQVGDEAAYAGLPNVIYCGRGAEAEQLAQQIARAVTSAIAPPPAPPPPPEPPPPPTVPADWYPDPHGKHRLRYWDGSAWTDHVAD